MKIAVVSNSCDVHARSITEVCNEYLKPKYEFTYHPYDNLHDTGWELVDFTRYDALLNIGFFVPVAIFTETIRRAEPDLKILNLWVGSDILQNMGHASMGLKQHPDTAKNYINMADAPNFVIELGKHLGIDARLVKTCPRTLPDVTPMPDKPQIIVYMPSYRAAFYNIEMMLECASMATDLTFAFVGIDASKAPSLPNARWMSFLNRDAWLAEIGRSSGMLRMPMHDGLSVSALEALAAGRWVATNQDMPHTRKVGTLMELYEAVRIIAETREVNDAGAAWVRENFAPKAMAESYRAVLEAIE